MPRTLCLLLLTVACSGENPHDPDELGPNVLTPAGGTIVLHNGAVTVVAPAGAVRENVTLSATIPSSGGPLDAAVVRGAIYTLNAAPAVTLQQPVRITINYEAANGPAGVPEGDFGLAQVNGAQWLQVSGATVDTLANRVSASVTSLGTFAARRSEATSTCTAPEHRQFDFWLGTWTVNTVPSDITREPSGCAIYEHYQAGIPGRSISLYDARTRKWYQTYVTPAGAPLIMSGGLENGRMVMFTFSASGQITSRWTWERNGDGTVTQRLESTNDNGATWQQGFNGIYRPR